MISPVRNPRRRAARLTITLVLVLVTSSLLVPDAVRSWAGTQPAGWRRVLARTWSEPTGRLARDAGLDRPLTAVRDALDPEPAVVFPVPAEPKEGVIVRRASPTDPLRVLAVGDSLMLDLQYGIERILEPRPDVEIEGRGALGFGFTVPHWDWEEDVLADYARLVAEIRPDVVVVMIGANEFEGHVLQGEALEPGSERWTEVLTERAGQAIAQWRAEGAPVYWWTTPRMRDTRFLTDDLNAIWDATATAWGDGVTSLDSMVVLGDASGAYQDRMVDEGGRLVDLRKAQGVHFHEVGADLLARQLEERLVADGWLVDD